MLNLFLHVILYSEKIRKNFVKAYCHIFNKLLPACIKIHAESLQVLSDMFGVYKTGDYKIRIFKRRLAWS